MQKSDSLKTLSEALAKAQSEMPKVKFNSVNPFLKNKFADLGAVIEASRPVLAKHGLSVTQFPTSEGDKIGVTTILLHSSGEWISDTVTMQAAEEKGKSAAQVAGSVITYLRRYSWSAVLGLYADEDTDGSHQGADKSDAPVEISLAQRYTKLLADAAALGIETSEWELPEKVTDDEITKLGKGLRALVDAKKAGK